MELDNKELRYDKIQNYTDEIDKQIINNNYDQKYLCYLVKYNLRSNTKNNLNIIFNGTYGLFKNTYIYGELSYKFFQNNKCCKDENELSKIDTSKIDIHVYFSDEQYLVYLLNYFNDFIVEELDSTIILLYHNLHIILHKKIIINILELLIKKLNHYYNVCIHKSCLYFHPLSYYAMNQSLKHITYDQYNKKYKANYALIKKDEDTIVNILKDVNINLEQMKEINILMDKYKINKNLFIITILINKHFDIFDILLNNDYVPLSFFTTNYVIFSMIEHGYLNFFRKLNEFEKKNKVIFNLNTLNQDGYLPTEYLLIRCKEVLLNSFSEDWDKIIQIYKQILDYLLFDRNGYCMANCECTCGCKCIEIGGKCYCKCQCVCNKDKLTDDSDQTKLNTSKCYCILNKKSNITPCYCQHINRSQYSRKILFFDLLCKTKFTQANTNSLFNNYISEAVDYMFKTATKYNNESLFSSSLKQLNINSYKINYVYLTILYRLINGDYSPISIDDIIEYIEFNKDYINFNSLIQVCKNQRSPLVISELLKRNIFSIENYKVITLLFDLQYFQILIKQKNYQNAIIKNIQKLLIHFINTGNIKGMELINIIDPKLYDTNINKNNDNILHYLAKQNPNDDLKMRQIGIFSDIILTHSPNLFDNINKNGENCIFNCTCSSNNELFKVFIDVGINVEIKNINGNTLAHELVLNNKQDFIDILFNEHNNLAYIKNDNGDLPITLALKERNIPIILKLLKIGNKLIDYDKIDNDGNTVKDYINLYGLRINYKEELKSNEQTFLKIGEILRQIK